MIELAGIVFLVGEWVIRVGMLPIIPYRRSPVAAKTWLLLVFFEPWIGLALYFLFGGLRLSGWRRQRLRQLTESVEEIKSRFPGHGSTTHPDLDPALQPSVRLAENLGHYPIVGGNHIELLSSYQASIDRLVSDIDKAERSVHLLYYIFADDATTEPVVEALSRAAGRGVACRVLVDAIGSRPWLRTLVPRLEGAGVQCETAFPLNLWRRAMSRPDLRNHRKIAAIDGSVGYTGSQNMIASDALAWLPYQELVARITGPVVGQLESVFATDWNVEREEVISAPSGSGVAPSGTMAAQVLPSGPGHPRGNNQRLMVSLVHGARSRVVITTPYFIPDEPFLQALETAVLRGVAVHLVVSERSDHWLVDLAQRSYYEQLLEAGVLIHRMQGKFLHAKHLSIDDTLVVVGSSNVDIRSFHLNEEVSLLVYDTELARELRDHEEAYFESAALLTKEEWARRGVVSDFLQHLARLFSPLL